MKSEWMWDKFAKTWDTPGVGLGENDIKIIDLTKKHIIGRDTILDYGCATGSIALELAGITQEVFGIDISSNMIAVANRKAEEKKIDNARFMHATIFDENLKPGSIDLILALNILHLLEDLPLVLKRINHLLKPEGVFISATPCLGEKKITSMLVTIPLFLLSKIGLFPHINFIKTSKLPPLIMDGNFQIIEQEFLSNNSITECLIVARKNK